MLVKACVMISGYPRSACGVLHQSATSCSCVWPSVMVLLVTAVRKLTSCALSPLGVPWVAVHVSSCTAASAAMLSRCAHNTTRLTH